MLFPPPETSAVAPGAPRSYPGRAREPATPLVVVARDVPTGLALRIAG